MKALRITFALLLAALLAVLALGGALWLWSGADASLATTLDLAARRLPADQTLEVKDVSGTLRTGGRIGWLRWRQGELSVEAQDAEMAWTLRGLLDGQLRLSRLSIRHLRVDDQRPPSPTTPPTDLALPLQVASPFSVGTVEWTGATPLRLTGLSGQYVFDGKAHQLDDARVQIAAGNYQLKGTLQAHSPLALSMDVQGQVQTTAPGSRQPLTVMASATAQGQLAGPDALLTLQARLTPERPTRASPPPRGPGAKGVAGPAMQASVSARIHPWQAQPVASADARWQALDLAALWPQAPHTLLDGQATVTPQASNWRAEVQLTNALSGPWDHQRLPVESLQARASHAAGQWLIESLTALGAGGRVQAQGHIAGAAPQPGSATTAARPWEGRATFQGINPAGVDSRLAAASLDGQLTAHLAPEAVAFEVQLQPSGRKTAAPGGAASIDSLRVKTLHATGRWTRPTLTLQTLQLQTDDAQLQGRLTFNTSSQAAEGQLSLSGPGIDAALAGQISSTSGQGDVSLRMTDAAPASRWLSRWPGMPPALARYAAQGTGEFKGHWQGGWQHQGRGLQVQATLTVPRLELRAPDAPPAQAWRVSDLQADLTGALAALQLTTRGQLEAGTRQFKLQAQARGGRAEDGAWQARVDSARLAAQDSLRPGTWTLQLSPGLTADWKRGANTRVLDVSAGQASLTGPAPGTARLDWQPLRWSVRDAGGTEWRSQGQVQGLPLGWLELLGGTQAANLGLRGDMVLGGQWELAAGDSLRLRASLERTGGDLGLQGDEGTGSTLSAGVREARVALAADGDELSASLRWDSERAGQAQASFKTRLGHQDGGWSWPADTPVTGSVRAQLPRVGVWSVLAPPGWRLRGTLDANATLTGTRAAPQWRGTLQADDLAVRSVVDGIEFSQGRLRASLDGQRLDVNEFSLRGASGAGGTGGLLTAKGFVLWPPADGSATAALMRLRMELDLQAQSLRVSARADRRLAVSGNLTARLADARLAVRGTLKADQALFILPEDTAPSLGDDVVVKATASGTKVAAPSPTTAPTPAPAPTGVRVTPDIAVTLDLGPDFQLRGRGLVTRLAGSVVLRSTAPGALQPRLTGEISTAGGTYKAYGQQLDIEEGVLRFAGPYDNPFLDVRAVRPNLTQRVGVQITGTALSPRVRLFAEPELPDAEKLAWLVLGRAGANGGAESAVLQQAALALLGGNGKGLSGGLAEALGLDELAVRGSSSNADGTTTTGATVTLGKRLSRGFYVAYERSLAGTLGTFYIFYDLSRRFTVRAQTGEHSAVDLIFTLRYD